LEPLFTTPSAWDGGYYELALELGPRSDGRLGLAVEALWRFIELEGCWTVRDLEPSDQLRVLPNLTDLEQHGHLLGVATVPGGHRIACGTYAVREDDGPDWIALYLPMGSLASAYAVGAYPFGKTDSRGWREPLDAWLVGIAQSVFAAAPFALGLVGFEVSGETRTAELANRGIPDQRWMGYLLDHGGKLTWVPPTEYGPQFSIGAS
jgi:hypothetical protein